MKIEKSAEMREKEARLADLEEQIKRTRTTLKGLKTRLRNTQQRVQDVQREMFSKASRMQERLMTGLKNLEQLTNKLRKDKRLSKQDKELIEEMYRGFAGGIGEEMPDLEAQATERAENQEEDAKFRDAFKAFRVEPPKAEQRDIRKLYLRLSKQFHPDRATTEKEVEQFHQFQQQVNEAYQKYDIQALLDLEQLFGDAAAEPDNGEAATTDVLDHNISRLENQLALLQQQQERLSQEIRQLRKSDMGEMLTEVDSMERAGYSIEEGTGLQQLEPIVQILESLEKALRDTDEKGRISPLFDGIMEQMSFTFNPLEALINEMMGNDGEDPDDMFWGGEDDYYPNLYPTFPEGTYVRIAEDVEIDYWDNGNSAFNLKGLSGIVAATLLDEGEEPIYNILLDTASMKRLPPTLISEQSVEFNVLYYLKEDFLEEEKRKKREPAKKVLQTYRTLLYQNIFDELPPEQRQRLQDILLAQPALSDEVNWLAYLEQNLPFPFDVFTRGEFGQWRDGRKATVLSYGGFAPQYGLIVQARIGRRTDFVPLAEFYGSPHSDQGQILDDYWEWYEVVF